jgi:L-fuconolactonase
MLECKLSFDALIKPVHLPRILALAQRYPTLCLILDHGAKPDIAAGQWSDWARGIAQLAGVAQVFCKLSGLWTEAAPCAGPQVLLPYGRHLLASFGAARTLWGSDWPVLERAGSYATWHASARDMVPEEARANVFGTAARRAYGLPDPI